MTQINLAFASKGRRALASLLASGALCACGNGGAPPEAGTGGANSGGAVGSGGLGSGGQGPGSGGAATGGASSGGSFASGGSASGGTGNPSGGTSSGGGGGSGGDVGSGGSGTGGSVGEVCPLPSTFSWTSSGPLAQPKSPQGSNYVSMKDFTVVHHDGQYLVYLTEYDTSSTWTGTFMKFSDWSDMATADQVPLEPIGSLGHVVAPTLFYFTPKSQWVLAYQWGFKFTTGSDASDPTTWGGTTNLLNGNPAEGQSNTGPIDQTVICDDTDCYLFFAADNGQIYRASMPIANFPATFSGAVSIMQDTTNNLFEAVQVYTVKGSDPVQYLMIVEAIGGGGRFFRAFTASDLGGAFTAMPNASSAQTPFAGDANVDFDGSAWTSEISHGDLVRYDASEKQYIDPCHLELLYQGKSANGPTYEEHPYRPGLLTLVTD